MKESCESRVEKKLGIMEICVSLTWKILWMIVNESIELREVDALLEGY